MGAVHSASGAVDRVWLEQLKQNAGQIPQAGGLAALTEELLPLLGSTDSQLRDELALEILWQWVAGGRYSRTELTWLQRRLTDNLRLGLGAAGDDSVLLRSFSALLLSAIIRLDNATACLGEEEILHLHAALLDYFAAENDWRGRSLEQGWIHALAHTADCFLALAGNRHLQPSQLLELLQAIRRKVTAPSRYVLRAEEDERLARALRGIVVRGLPTGELPGWFRGFRQPADGLSWKELFLSGEMGEAAYLNSKNLLRSLYFQALQWDHPAAAALSQCCCETLQAMQFFRYQLK